MLNTKTLLAGAAVLAMLGTASIGGMAFAGAGAKGHGHAEETAFGQAGDPDKKSRVIEISMTEGSGVMGFEPNEIRVKKGEQIRFTLKNTGELDHEIVIATLEENLAHAVEMEKNPDMEHDDPNARRLAPSGSGEILWKFTKAGTFDMSCLIPGHREAGMTGTIIVE